MRCCWVAAPSAFWRVLRGGRRIDLGVLRLHPHGVVLLRFQSSYLDGGRDAVRPGRRLNDSTAASGGGLWGAAVSFNPLQHHWPTEVGEQLHGLHTALLGHPRILPSAAGVGTITATVSVPRDAITRRADVHGAPILPDLQSKPGAIPYDPLCGRRPLHSTTSP